MYKLNLDSLNLGCQAQKDTDRSGKPRSFSESLNRDSLQAKQGRVTPGAPRHEPAVVFAYKKLFMRDNL